MLCIIWKSRIGCFIRRVNTNKDIGVLVKFLLHYKRLGYHPHVGSERDLPFFLKNGCINDNYAISILLLGHSLLGLKIRAQKLFFWGLFGQHSPETPKWHLFFWVRGPTYTGAFNMAGPRFPPSLGPFGLKMSEKCAPKRFFFQFYSCNVNNKTFGEGEFLTSNFLSPNRQLPPSPEIGGTPFSHSRFPAPSNAFEG